MNQIEPGYPKVMVHPGYAAAVLSTEHYKGSPARWPPITVYKHDDELKERAQGYLLMGEPMPERRPEYVEYPMMLIHPDHVEGIPEETRARKDWEGGPIIYTKIEGRAEIYPPVVVNNSAEREVWETKGYRMKTAPDPEAYLKATATAKPKHETIEPNEYPKWVQGKIVNNRDEENALLGIATQVVQETPAIPDNDLQAKYYALLEKVAMLERKTSTDDKKAERSRKMKEAWAKRRAKNIGEPSSPQQTTS